MASAISSLNSYSTQHGDDLFVVVDTHDTTMAPSGTDKRATTYQVFGSPSNNQLIAWAGSTTGTPVGVTVGSGLSLSGGQLTATGGTGSVTTVSVASANGFTGSVATATSTPAITLGTSVTGILKGGSGAIAAATAGTDYVLPSGNITGTAAGLSSTLAVGSGGTGATALTGILKGNGTSAFTAAAAGTDFQVPITLTTTGTSGAATFSGGVLNVPQYTGGSGSGTVNSGTAGQVAIYATSGTAVSGVAVSGDATISSSGVLTVTKTNGVAFAPSATTDTTSASNISSGTLSASRLPTTGLAIASSYSAITADTDAATITFNLATSNWHSVTLGGNRTLAISNATVGQQFTLMLTQDSTGSRTVTWFSGITWAAGSAPTLQTAAGAIDVITFKCTASGAYLGFTANSSAGTGSVTTASIVSANGFSGTVANPTTTPAITLSTTVSGIHKGSSGAIVAATAGVDFQLPITLTTTGSSGAATFSGGVLNVPQYSGGSGSGTVNSGTSGQVAYYNASGTPVSGEGLSALMDSALTSTQGAIAIRGGSLWGTQSGLSYDVGNNCPKLAVIGDPGTANAGDLWFSTRPRFARQSTLITDLGGPIYRCGACTAVTNTTSWTSLLGSPAWSEGSLTIPANSLVQGDTLDVKLYGVYSTTASVTLQLRVLFGGTVIGLSPVYTFAAYTGYPFLPSFPFNINFPTVGSGGVAICAGRLMFITTSTTVADIPPNGYNATPSVSVSTAAAALLDIQVQWSSASSSNSMQVSSFVLSLA